MKLLAACAFLFLSTFAHSQIYNPGGGGATTPATSVGLCGTGTANGVRACTPGTDYATPSQIPTTAAQVGAAGPIYNVLSYGAVCDGVTDDTAKIAAAALASTGGGILYIPFLPTACMTSATVALPYTASMEIEGTLRATASMASVITTGDSTHRASRQSIFGHGYIDPQGNLGFGRRGILVANFAHYTVQDVSVGNATIFGIEMGDAGISGNSSYEGYVLNTVVMNPNGIAKVTGSVAIGNPGSTDSYFVGNIAIGYDYGFADYRGNIHVSNNHCWGNSPQQPTTCYFNTSTNGSFWTNDVADGASLYGFDLAGSGDKIEGAEVNSNPFSGTLTSAVHYALTNPNASITNSIFFGKSSTLLMNAVVAGSTSGVSFTNDTCGPFVTNCNIGGVINNLFAVNVGSALASAATIAPLNGIQHVSGTTAIATITPPASMSSTSGGCITLIADGAWTTTTAGNIFATMTAVAGTPYQACYEGTKWYIK